ncbi:MAG: SLATT domain-containing protein [Chitinophagaceae bacterium]|nr:MAG: SLATT domain-containing protein [Chitinophagaceae bacterium]
MTDTFIPSTRKELITRWLVRLRLLEVCHYEAAKPLAKMNMILGIPVIILTTVVGTTVFATLQKAVDPEIRLWVGIISLAAAVLAGLQTFLRFSARATLHRENAASAGMYRRELEQIIADNDIDKLTKEEVTTLREKIDLLAKTDISIPSNIFERFRDEQ